MKYVAFFRGINVGGKNIVKMADLKQLFLSLGFEDVKTYIQSGNVIFTSGKEDQVLVPLISQAFEAQFGFSSAVIIRSHTQMADIARCSPFTPEQIQYAHQQDPAVAHMYVYLSAEELDSHSAQQLLCAHYDGEDKFYIDKYEIYLLCCQSVRLSRLAALLAKLPYSLTARNLKTIHKINSML